MLAVTAIACAVTGIALLYCGSLGDDVMGKITMGAGGLLLIAALAAATVRAVS